MKALNGKLSLPDRLIHLLSGMSDGLIIPLVIATSMNAGGASSLNIFSWGLILACFGACILGFVSYLTARDAGNDNHEHDLLARLDIPHGEGVSISDEVMQEDEAWQQLNKDAELEQYASHRYSIAVFQAAGYLLGGLLILVPYLIQWDADYSKITSVLIALIALLVVGVVKAKLTGVSALKTSLRLATLGTLSAALCQYIISLFVK